MKLKAISSAALFLLTFGGAYVHAAPTITAVSISPTTAAVNSPTTVTVTATVTDPLLLPTSVTLVRVDAGSSTVVGSLHDDGRAGDVAAGDNIYTTQILVNEYEPTTIQFSVSAAFRGFPRRVTSLLPVVTVPGIRLSQLVTLSSTVVIGTVATINSYNVGNSIDSDLTIQVASTIKGSQRPTSVTVTVGGGTVNGVTQHWPLAGTIAPGTELLLLLAGPDSNNKFTVPQGPLGVFYIQPDPVLGSIAIVDPGYTSLDLALPLDPSFAALLEQSSAHLLSLSSLTAALTNQ